MSQIKSADTKPEMAIRRALHKRGYRYRTHDRLLPGTPDLVFRGRRRVIFVNGCFWHSHECKYGRVTPGTNSDFWKAKRAATVDRDFHNASELQAAGWQVLTVWECELRDFESAIERVCEFLKT